MFIYFLAYGYPFILISTSIAIKVAKPKYPPNKKSPIKSGFTSKASMQSEAHWNYTQRVAPNIMIIAGVIDALIMTLMYIFYSKNIVSENMFENLSILFGTLTIVCGSLIIDYKVKRLQI